MGDPFGGRFGNFGGFGAFRGGSLFGGRDPFDDPFFSRPFEDFLEPGASFSNANAQNNSGGRGLTIEEVASDEEQEKEKDSASDEKHTSSENQPSVEHPEDDADAERRIRNVNQRSGFNTREGRTESRATTFRHHTSKVTYGGIDGAYYTSSRTTRAGSDGMVVEESKEADKTTGEATHRISRGINDKGHSVTRKLNSNGGVDSTQTLHNLDEDELSGFEEAWKGNSFLAKHESTGSDPGVGEWLLPSLNQTRRRADQSQTGSSRSSPGAKRVVRINIE